MPAKKVIRGGLRRYSDGGTVGMDKPSRLLPAPQSQKSLIEEPDARGVPLSREWFENYGSGPEYLFLGERKTELPEGWVPRPNDVGPGIATGNQPSDWGSILSSLGTLGSLYGEATGRSPIQDLYDGGRNLYDRYFGEPEAISNAEEAAQDTSATNEQIEHDLSQLPNPADNPALWGDIAGLGVAGLGSLAASAAAPAGTAIITEAGGQLASQIGAGVASSVGAGAGAAGAAGTTGAATAGGTAAGAGTGTVAGALGAFATVAPLIAAGFAIADFFNAKGDKKSAMVSRFMTQAGFQPWVAGRALGGYKMPDGRLMRTNDFNKLYEAFARGDVSEYNRIYETAPVSRHKARGGLATYSGGGMVPQRGGLSMAMARPSMNYPKPYYRYGAQPQPMPPPRMISPASQPGGMPLMQMGQPIQTFRGPQRPMQPPMARAMGGLAMYGFQSGGSTERLVRGPGTGRSDEIPARLSPGEYVFDSETVALLGDGSTDEGARRLDELRQKLRMHKGKQLSKGKFSSAAKNPEAYLE